MSFSTKPKKDVEVVQVSKQAPKTGKQEEFNGVKVERKDKGFICREEKGSAGCGTVLQDEDELRNHMRHIHQKNVSGKKEDNTATQVNPSTDFK